MLDFQMNISISPNENFRSNYSMHQIFKLCQVSTMAEKYLWPVHEFVFIWKIQKYLPQKFSKIEFTISCWMPAKISNSRNFG